MVQVQGKRVMGRVLVGSKFGFQDTIVKKLVTLEGEREGVISVRGKQARVFRSHINSSFYEWVFEKFVS